VRFHPKGRFKGGGSERREGMTSRALTLVFLSEVLGTNTLSSAKKKERVYGKEMTGGRKGEGGKKWK